MLNKYIVILCIILVNYFNSNAQARRITSTASAPWTVPIATITEAGSDYVGEYVSATNQVIINASVPLLLGNAKVSVQQSSSATWHNQLKLSIKRNGPGSTLCVLCSISGGDNYIPLSTTSIDLFQIVAVLALAEYNNIPLQLKLTGVSVTLPAAIYETTLIYTIGPI